MRQKLYPHQSGSALDPQAKCPNCDKYLQFMYKGNNKIPKRTKDTVCQCSRGIKARIAMADHISAFRKKLELKKGIAKRIAAKDPMNIDRSPAIAREKKSREARAKKMKDPNTNPNWVKRQKDKELKRHGD